MATDQLVDDATREAAVDRISDGLVVGRLTREEFDVRLDTALRARTEAQLADALSGLPVPSLPQARPRGSARMTALRRPVAVVGAICAGVSLAVAGYLSATAPGEPAPPAPPREVSICWGTANDSPDC